MNFNLADIYKQVIITYKDSEKINFDKTMLFFSVYRYLSFPITAVFIWLGISANITSLIGFILLLISFYLFLFCSFDFNTLALCLFLFGVYSILLMEILLDITQKAISLENL